MDGKECRTGPNRPIRSVLNRSDGEPRRFRHAKRYTSVSEKGEKEEKRGREKEEEKEGGGPSECRRRATSFIMKNIFFKKNEKQGRIAPVPRVEPREAFTPPDGHGGPSGEPPSFFSFLSLFLSLSSPVRLCFSSSFCLGLERNGGMPDRTVGRSVRKVDGWAWRRKKIRKSG